jgi:tRNA nucleotidyltransferase (CCA-adding enzyme)
MKIYLVGGAVRDQLLSYPYHEHDWVVVGESPGAMLSLGYQQIGKDFPVFIHPETGEEYALARTERKTGPGYSGFTFQTSRDISLEQDLSRRDLTINAIAQTPEGDIIDPYNGVRDLREKTLRHVSSAFSEDPVRILRTARFAARYHHLGFTIADQTMTLMRQMVEQGEADHLVAERCWKEFERALGEKNPEIFIRVLRQCGALQRLLPELDNLFGVVQRNDPHLEIDCGIHSLMALQQACQLSKEKVVRFAALTHGLGKAETPIDLLPNHIGHEQRSSRLIKGLCTRLKIPSDYQQLALQLAEHHEQCHRARKLEPAGLLKIFQALDIFRKPQRFEHFLLCCIAVSRKDSDNTDHPQTSFLKLAADELCSIQVKQLIAQGYQGSELGEALNRSRIQVLAEYKQRNIHND